MFSHTTAGKKITAATPWVVLCFLWIAFLFNNVDRQVVFSIFPILAKQLHFTRVQLGLIGSIFLWVYCGTNPLLGRLSDVVQRERLIAGSMVLWSVATVGTALSFSIGTFLFWRAALGLAESLYTPAALSSIAAWHPGRTRSTALAIHSTSQFTGLALGGWAGGMMAETVGWRPGFSALGAAGIVYAGLLMMFLRRNSRPAAETKKTEVSPLDILRSRCFIALLISYTLFAVMLFIFYNWLPEFVFSKFHLSLSASGLAATGYLQGGAVLGGLTWGFVADYLATRVPAGRFYLISLDMLGCAPLAIVILTVKSVLALKLAAAAFGFFAGGLSANIVAAAYDVVAMKNYGFTSGLINLAAGVGGGCGVLLVGLTDGPSGVGTIMKWISLLVVAGAVTVVVVPGRSYVAERANVLFRAERDLGVAEGEASHA